MLEPASGRRRPHGAGEQAAERLRQAISSGRLAPGERLKEEQLAQELGISRTPVREALLILRTEGLVRATPSGAVVRTYEPEDLDKLYRLRAHLEGYGARMAAASISRRTLAELRRSCERFDALETGEDHLPGLLKENSFFHTTVLEAADDERLVSIVRGVTEFPLVYRSYVWYSPDQKGVSAQAHRQLTRALGAADGERAEMIMKEHLLAARDVLLDRLAEDERGRRGVAPSRARRSPA